MADILSLTVSLPVEIADLVEAAVESGEYASANEVVNAALHDWQQARALQLDALHALKIDIAAGLADIEAQRVEAFDAARIIKRGRKLSTARSPSA